VITGASGGEFDIRGLITAYDAATGKEVWRSTRFRPPARPVTGPGPRRQHGGAPVWQTPSVDPELGLLYFSTGNAGPDNNGSDRAETRKPIFPTPEQAVPQNVNQKTAKTQPIPSYAPVVPQVPTQAQYQAVVQQATKAAGHSAKAIKATEMFTPFWQTTVVLTLGPHGGTNWQPSSVSPWERTTSVPAEGNMRGA